MKIGTTELIVILAVVVIIFGPTQIPKLMKMVGESLKALREGIGGSSEKDETSKQNTMEKIDTAANEDSTK